jgi:hypothetical protein
MREADSKNDSRVVFRCISCAADFDAHVSCLERCRRARNKFCPMCLGCDSPLLPRDMPADASLAKDQRSIWLPRARYASARLFDLLGREQKPQLIGELLQSIAILAVGAIKSLAVCLAWLLKRGATLWNVGGAAACGALAVVWLVAEIASIRRALSHKSACAVPANERAWEEAPTSRGNFCSCLCWVLSALVGVELWQLNLAACVSFTNFWSDAHKAAPGLFCAISGIASAWAITGAGFPHSSSIHSAEIISWHQAYSLFCYRAALDLFISRRELADFKGTSCGTDENVRRAKKSIRIGAACDELAAMEADVRAWFPRACYCPSCESIRCEAAAWTALPADSAQ